MYWIPNQRIINKSVEPNCIRASLVFFSSIDLNDFLTLNWLNNFILIWTSEHDFRLSILYHRKMNKRSISKTNCSAGMFRLQFILPLDKDTFLNTELNDEKSDVKTEFISFDGDSKHAQFLLFMPINGNGKQMKWKWKLSVKFNKSVS